MTLTHLNDLDELNDLDGCDLGRFRPSPVSILRAGFGTRSSLALRSISTVVRFESVQ